MRVLKLGAQTILIASSFFLSLALQVHGRCWGRLLKFKLMLKALFDSKYPLPSSKTNTGTPHVVVLGTRYQTIQDYKKKQFLSF